MTRTVDEYIEARKGKAKEHLEQLRKLVLSTAPNAEEYLSYGMPAYKLNKKILIYFAAHTEHVGVYPGRIQSYDMDERLKKYAHGKSTLQFRHDEDLPLDLIEGFLKYRIKEITGDKNEPKS